MPFIPAVVAASLIGGGAGVGAGFLAKRGAENSAKTIAQQQQDQANYLQQLTRPAFDKSYGYYSGLLGNDPEKLMTSIGPDVNNTNMLFANAQRNMLSSSQARGGGLTAGLAGLEGGRAATISNLVGTARSGAAAALGNLANGQQVQALQALAGAQQSQFQNAALQQQAFGGIGSFLMRMLTSPLVGNMFNNNSFSNPVARVPSVVGAQNTNTWFNPTNTDFGNPEINYFPGMRA